MLATLLVAFVLQAICVTSENPYIINQVDGDGGATVHVPRDFIRLRVDGDDYEREGKYCINWDGAIIDCSYDPVRKTATADGFRVPFYAWMGFELSPTEYITVYFSQGGAWDQVLDRGCIQPQHSSPGLIVAENDATNVTIKCARKTTCNEGDSTLTISIEGTKKCEKGGADELACAVSETNIKNVEAYELIVRKPTNPLPGNKTYVYCGTATTQMSYVIEWTPSETTSIVKQASGKYEVLIFVPEEYTKLKLDDVEYTRKDSTCTGPNDKTLPCSYDPVIKTAYVKIEKVEDNAWVGFEMYPTGRTDKVAGYQTVYFSQDSTWKQVLAKGCIQPQHSSPGLIVAENDATNVTIKCARKTTCNEGDSTLTISIEGTKKCEKNGADELACAVLETNLENVEAYEFSVPKPTNPLPDGKTYVYCGTATSQMSYVIEWPAEPTTAEPTTAEPTTAEPTTAEPTTAEPTTAEPTTAEPTTAEPTTAEPTTSGVSRLAYVIAPVWALAAMIWM